MYTKSVLKRRPMPSKSSEKPQNKAATAAAPTNADPTVSKLIDNMIAKLGD